MKHLFFAFILLMIHKSAMADITYGMKVKCLENWGFEISSYNLVNGKPEEGPVQEDLGENAYFDKKNHKIQCNLNEETIDAEFKFIDSTVNGECGQARGAYVNLSINRDVILKQGLFSNACFQSVNKILITIIGKGITFEICGHTGLGSNPRVSGCFQFKDGLYEMLPKPLTPFPISKIIANQSLNSTPKSGAN